MFEFLGIMWGTTRRLWPETKEEEKCTEHTLSNMEDYPWMYEVMDIPYHRNGTRMLCLASMVCTDVLSSLPGRSPLNF